MCNTVNLKKTFQKIFLLDKERIIKCWNFKNMNEYVLIKISFTVDCQINVPSYDNYVVSYL